MGILKKFMENKKPRDADLKCEEDYENDDKEAPSKDEFQSLWQKSRTTGKKTSFSGRKYKSIKTGDKKNMEEKMCISAFERTIAMLKSLVRRKKPKKSDTCPA